MLDQNPYSRLYVPYGAKTKPSLMWRMTLVKKTGVYPYSQLMDLCNTRARGEISDDLRKKWMRIVQEEERIQLTQGDHIELGAGFLLSQIQKFRPKVKSLLNPLYKMYCSAGLDTSLLATDEKSTQHLEKHGRSLYFKALKRVRAKLAVHEIIASPLGSEQMALEMIKLSSRYLGCDFCQEWLDKTRWNLRYGSEHQRNGARRLLRRLQSYIIGDGRKKTAIYDALFLYRYFLKLRAIIEGFHDQVLNCPDLLELYCNTWDIPDIYRTSIANKTRGAADLAIE